MATELNNNTDKQAPAAKPEKRKNLWLAILKWLAVAVGAVVALIIVVCTLVVWILTPAKLTPMVEKYGSEAINGTLEVDRVELSFWKTFPRLTVEVDSLRLISHSLQELPDSVKQQLPADADSLLHLDSFSGGVNLLALFKGTVSLHNVTFNGLRVNLLQATDSVSNFDIMLPSEEKEKPDTAALSLPDIAINRFALTEATPIRFRSLPDSLDVTAHLQQIEISDNGMPRDVYRLTVDGAAETSLLAPFALNPLTFGAQGNIHWASATPMRVALDDFTVTIDEYEANFATAVDFSKNLTIETLSATVDRLKLERLLRHVPEEYAALAKPVKTSLTVNLSLQLNEPYTPGDSLLPSCTAMLHIPGGSLSYEEWAVSNVEAQIQAQINGRDFDRSVITVKKLLLNGNYVNFNFRGDATQLESDPLVSGRFIGMLNLSKLPQQVADMLPVSVGGTVDGNIDFRLHASDISRDNFHKLFADGQLRLDNLSVADDGMGTAWLRKGDIKFGSNNSLKIPGGVKIDSLLTVAMNIDTLSVNALGMDLSIRDLHAGAGTVNKASSADTTEINPFGLMLSMDRLRFDAPDDSLHVRLNNAKIGGSLRRFNNDAHLPRINLKLSLGRLFMGKALNKVALREADVALDLHMRAQRQRTGTRAVASAGSTSAGSSGVATGFTDGNSRSATLAAQRRAALSGASSAAVASETDLDLRLDSADRRLLRRWDFQGHVKAARGRIVTPYFPLRNRLENIDLTFNADTIALHDLRYTAGQSDFTVNGTISNVRRALTSRRNNTLGVQLSLASDTINVNQIVRALFTGGAIAQATDSATVWTDSDRDTDSQFEQMADTAATAPLIVPRNLDASLEMRARNILYSDLVLHDFNGNLLVFDGAVNLRNLSASTDIGSLNLNALYAAPDTSNMQFGMGMKVDRFQLHSLSELVPAIDSLMPALKEFAGIVDADLAVSTRLQPNMDIDIPTLKAAIKIEGDSLVLLDAETFKTVSKWLLFKNKKRNMIDHMAVEVIIENSAIELYPFRFDIDRYRLGVMGHNDLAMNLDYHVSVLKSPIPFKFGINIKGTPEKMKIRLGGAKFKENMVGEREQIAANTRINIVEQLDNVFRRGLEKARTGSNEFLDTSARANTVTLGKPSPILDVDADRLSYADSLQFIRQGLIENPDTTRYTPSPAR